jgi:hypothetical protein
MEGGVTCSYRGTGGPESRNSSSAEGQNNSRDTSTSSGCIPVYSTAAPSDESPQSGASYGDSVNNSSRGDSERPTEEPS